MKIKSSNILKMCPIPKQLSSVNHWGVNSCSLGIWVGGLFSDPFSWRQADTEPGPEGHSDENVNSVPIGKDTGRWGQKQDNKITSLSRIEHMNGADSNSDG